MQFTKFNCPTCGKRDFTREWFNKHLITEHPDTWLAKRIAREEQARLLKESTGGTSRKT